MAIRIENAFLTKLQMAEDGSYNIFEDMNANAAAIGVISGSVSQLTPGWEFFMDSLGSQESSTDIKYAITYHTVTNGVDGYVFTNNQAEPGGTKQFVDYSFSNVDSAHFEINRVSPDNSTFYNASISFTTLQGSYDSITSLATPSKSLPYSISSGTTVNGGDDWTWSVNNPSADLKLRITITEKQ